MPEVRRPHGNPGRRCEDTIKMDTKGIGSEDVDGFMTQDRDRWRTLVNKVMNLRVPQKVGNFLNS
jgi:hypothetical protein